jgi:hypothetical protein
LSGTGSLLWLVRKTGLLIGSRTSKGWDELAIKFKPPNGFAAGHLEILSRKSIHLHEQATRVRT